MQQHLQKQISEKAAIERDWRVKIETIQSQIAAARAAIVDAEAERKKHALQASLGEQKALTEIGRARGRQTVAEGDLKDLGHALDEALAQLAEAEGEAKTARNNLAAFELNILKHKSVAAAVDVDKAISAFMHALREFEKIQNEIGNADVPNPHGIFTDHGTFTMRLVRAAFPKPFDRIARPAVNDEMPKMPLAKSVASQWGLPPIQSDEKAA